MYKVSQGFIYANLFHTSPLSHLGWECFLFFVTWRHFQTSMFLYIGVFYIFIAPLSLSRFRALWFCKDNSGWGRAWTSINQLSYSYHGMRFSSPFADALDVCRYTEANGTLAIFVIVNSAMWTFCKLPGKQGSCLGQQRVADHFLFRTAPFGFVTDRFQNSVDDLRKSQVGCFVQLCWAMVLCASSSVQSEIK